MTITEEPVATHENTVIGTRLLRKEDPRLLTGGSGSSPTT